MSSFVNIAHKTKYVEVNYFIKVENVSSSITLFITETHYKKLWALTDLYT